MPGHVFIVRGDLSRFACDAWLMPCDFRTQPLAGYFPPGYTGPRTGRRFDEVGPRTQRFAGWPDRWPQPWLTNTGGANLPDLFPVGWYMDAVAEFLKDAGQEVSTAGYAARAPRALPLLAMPIIGTGYGGAAERAGEIVQYLLPILEDFVRTHDVDVALVDRDMGKHAAAQAERDRRVQDHGWCQEDELREDLCAVAKQLAIEATSGRLALFLGAGLSMAAGLPSWSNLLAQLGQRAGMSEAELKGLASLDDLLDQATYLERKLTGTTIGEEIQAIFDPYQHYSLGHALLAALPVHEVITTNYDRLFDAAWGLVDGEGISVLPGHIKPDTRRWLLKMHGCISDPARIVLTRASYLRYDENLPGLAGIVQAFLITRHMLFVGFSLTDANFHRLIDDVQRIRGIARAEGELGTVLTLLPDPVREVLWQNHLRLVSMISRAEIEAVMKDIRARDASLSDQEVRKKAENVLRPKAARRLEILLDRVAYLARGSNHLLAGEWFAAVLTAGERQLSQALRDFRVQVDTPEVRKTAAWPEVKRMLINLGHTPT
jgi:hypothetical protein